MGWGWNKKEVRENKDFKKGGKLSQGVCALKKRKGLSNYSNKPSI